MTFLRINGITLPAKNESPTRTINYTGKQSPAFTNRPKRNRTSEVDSHTATLCFIDMLEGDALEGLIEGRGHHFSFDWNAWSEAGLGPEAGAGYSIIQNAPQARFGYGRLSISTSITYNPQLRSKWTVLYWRTDDSGATWSHVTSRSDGAVWVNGVRDDSAAISELTVSNGAVAFGSAFELDDLIILPYMLGDDHPHAIYNWCNDGDRAFSSLPELVMDGDIIGGRESVVFGTIDSEDYSQRADFGGIVNNQRELRVKFDEKQSTQKRVPDADRLWLCDESYLTGSSLRPVKGVVGDENLTLTDVTTGLPGVFGLYGESFSFNGSTSVAAAGNNPGRALGGSPAASVSVIARRAGTGSETLVSVAGAAVTQRVTVGFDGSDQVQVVVVESSGNPFQVATSTATITDTLDHLIVAVVDVYNDTIKIYIDGRLDSETAVTFTDNWFDDQEGPTRLGVDITGAAGWFTGNISSAGLYNRRLKPGAISAYWQLLKEGQLF